MAFNTTPFHGKVARIEKGEVPVDWSISFSLDVSLDMADISRQGQHWKEQLPGMAGASGTMEYQLVLGNTEQKELVDNIVTATPGSKLTDVQFNLDLSTNAFTGNIYITGFSVSATIGDVVKGTFPFVLDGALSVTSTG